MDASTFAVAVGAAKKYTNSAITALGNGFNYKGSKTNYEDLSAIVNPKLGDFWTYINYAGHEVNGEAVWDGTRWQKLGEEAFIIITEDCNLWELTSGLYKITGNIYISNTDDWSAADGNPIIISEVISGNYKKIIASNAQLDSCLEGIYQIAYSVVEIDNPNIVIDFGMQSGQTYQNMVTAITSSAASSEYPNVAAVYNAIQANGKGITTVSNCNIWELASGVYIAGEDVVCGTDETINSVLFNTTVYEGESALYSYVDGDGYFIYGYVYLENNIIVDEQQHKVETLTHKVSIVNSTSDDYMYPTAKAVYDAIQAALYVDSEVTV